MGHRDFDLPLPQPQERQETVSPFQVNFFGAGSFYSPHQNIFIDTSQFIVKTANSYEELIKVFRLRHLVYCEELHGSPSSTQLEIDEFDSTCDHLIIIEKSSAHVIGTYRVRSTLYHQRFYSETEFAITPFLKQAPGEKIEVGRACIHPKFRTGAVLNLLWRGIAEYLKRTQASFLFGCSSVHDDSIGRIQGILAFLNQSGKWNQDYEVIPFNNLIGPLSFDGVSPDGSLIPPLMDFYLKIGSYVMGFPAYDPAFKCFDFFTVLNLTNLPKTVAKRYGLCL